MRCAVATLGVLLGGCSLTQSLDHLSYDGGSGGAAAAGTTAATGPTSGATSSATATSSSSSGSVGSSSGTGGGAGEGGGAPGSPCAEPHAFCADFEDGLGDWTYQIVDEAEGATLETSEAFSTSPSRSLRASLPRLPDVDTPIYATTVKDFVGSSLVLHLRMQLRVEPADWQEGDVNTGMLALACYAGEDAGPALAMSVGEDYVSIAFPHLAEPDGVTLPPLPFGEWVEIDLVFDPLGGLSGTVADAPVRETWPSSAIPPDTCSLTVGLLGYNDPAPAFEVFVDDVVVDL